MFIFSSLGSVIGSEIAKHKAREDWLNSLPKEKADKIRAEDRARYLDEKAHKRALEIAEAGRPRNFWGQ